MTQRKLTLEEAKKMMSENNGNLYLRDKNITELPDGLTLGGSLYLGRRLGSRRSRLILAAAAGSRKNKYQRQKQREQSVGTISFHLSIPLFLKDFNQKTGHVRFYPQYSV